MPPRRRVPPPDPAILFNPPIPVGSKWKPYKRPKLTKAQLKAKQMADEKAAAEASQAPAAASTQPPAAHRSSPAKVEKPVDDGKPRTEERDRHRVPDFGRQPSTVLICGKSGAGKTTAIRNAIDPTAYDNVFIVTATKHKHNLSDFVEDEAFILEDMSDEFINMLTEHHKKNTKATTLLLFDDHVGINFNFKASKPYKKLCAASRNFNITIIDSCQDIAEVPKILRRNAHWLLFGNNYDANNDMIADQLSIPDLPKPQFRRVLQGIAKRREYEWLVYDDRRQDWWIWQPEYVEGLGDAGGDDDSDDDDSDETDSDDEGRNKIMDDQIPQSVKVGQKRTADQIGLARASHDAKKARKD